MTYITFDTSFLENLGFDFDFIFFEKIDKSNHTLIISEIVDKEIRKHLKKWVSPFEDGIRAITPLKNEPKYKDIVGVDAKNDVINVYERFLKKHNAIVVPTNESKPDDVFIDYFNRGGAFKNAGKKNEFPDAFALSSIKNFVGDNDLIVLSCDNDWINDLSRFKNITIYQNRFDAIIGFCKEDAVTDIVNKYFEKRVNLLGAIQDEFFSEAIKQQYYDEESEVDESNCEIIVDEDSIEIAGIEIDDKHIDAYINFDYSFILSFFYYNYDEATYDKEDGMVFNVVPMDAVVEGKESGLIHFSFEIVKNNLHIKKHDILDSDFCFWENGSSYKITETTHEPFDKEW